MKKKKPKFMLIYQCTSCLLDSGFTELETDVKCYYCESRIDMKLVSKQVLTKEVMADRLKIITDRLFTNLQAAYETMTPEQRNLVSESGDDLEKEMLQLLHNAKKLKDNVLNLKVESETKS